MNHVIFSAFQLASSKLALLRIRSSQAVTFYNEPEMIRRRAKATTSDDLHDGPSDMSLILVRAVRLLGFF